MLQRSPNTPQLAIRFNGPWLAARCWLVLVAGICLWCEVGQVVQAGCQHGATAAAHNQHNSELAVDSSLLGRWQYMGGQVFYIFHPQPTPCDGPNCHNSPNSPSEMDVIPPSVERNVSIGHSCVNSCLARPPLTSAAIPSTDFHVTSPMLAGILRPPCAA